MRWLGLRSISTCLARRQQNKLQGILPMSGNAKRSPPHVRILSHTLWGGIQGHRRVPPWI